MGSRQLHLLARLAGGSAEFIATYPEAATFFARELEKILNREACEVEDREREDRDDMKRRGFG